MMTKRKFLVHVCCPLVLMAAFVYADSDALAARASATSVMVPICEEVCTTETVCTEECYENLMEFENGNDITCLEYGVYDHDQFCCGDFLCDLTTGESCGNCVADCGPCMPTTTCGSNGCEYGEDCHSCSSDCGSCDTGSGCNDDGTCQAGEDASCWDCLVTERSCTSSSQCSSPGAYDLVCVDGRCIAEDFPSHTSQCITDEDCSWGWACQRTVDIYSCGTCSVCVPWS